MVYVVFEILVGVFLERKSNIFILFICLGNIGFFLEIDWGGFVGYCVV